MFVILRKERGYANWEKAVDAFKQKAPEIGRALRNLITKQRKTNKAFIDALSGN